VLTLTTAMAANARDVSYQSLIKVWLQEHAEFLKKTELTACEYSSSADTLTGLT
jgi:hypothetical protein